MFILSAGFTYKKTPLQLREKITVASNDLPEVNKKISQEKSVLENVVISTCNRTEIFAVVDQLHTGRYYLKHFLARQFQLSAAEIEPFLVFYEDELAVGHCFRICCGLDSMVIGETQILGQVKQGIGTAQQAGTTGTILNYLFSEGIRLAKEMHTRYEINHHSASLSHSALQMAKNACGSLTDKKVFVLGAGEMSALLIKNTQNFEIGSIRLFNRKADKAEKLRKWAGCPFEVSPLADFYPQINEADVVIALLGVKEPYITKDLLENARRQTSANLLLIDLGVPRNIASDCRQLPNVQLWDIDEVSEMIQSNQQKRLELVSRIERHIQEATGNFFQWEHQLGIIPIIQKIREQSIQVQESAMESLLRKMPDLSEREVKLIRKHMKSIVNQTLRTPIKEIKEIAVEENAVQDIAVIQRVFGVSPKEGSAVKSER